MVRYFCDVCGEELRKGESARVHGEVGRVSFEVMTAIDGTWNNGLICHACVVKAINSCYPEAQP